ncbi:hypothetical protein LXL04_013657 [Taraxacum kok-saghyz]
MESSAWLPELEMQAQGFMNQYQMTKPYHHMMDDFSVESFSSESYPENPSYIDHSFQTPKSVEEPSDIKQLSNCYKKPNNINMKFTPTEKPTPKLVSDSPNTFTISFGEKKPKDEILSFSDSLDFTDTKKVPTMIRNPIQVQDHVIAERKRREKLAQRFVSLSSLLPDLKKMDKATVLEEAANYIQELQNRVKELEGLSEVKRKNAQESDISGKRSRLISCSDDDGSSSNGANFEESSSACNPEIEVRESGSSLLIEIYSRKNCTTLFKVLKEMQKLGLSVISNSTMPFADTALLITMVAQKNDDFMMSSTDLVKNLQLAICTSN